MVKSNEELLAEVERLTGSELGLNRYLANVQAELRNAYSRMQSLEKNSEKLRQTLEIIAVGDSANPKLAAKDTLVEIGFWENDKLVERPRGPRP